jgi:hypothetical protein
MHEVSQRQKNRVAFSALQCGRVERRLFVEGVSKHGQGRDN